MAQYLPILVLLVLAALFAAGSFVASGLLAPRKPTEEKLGPYECGIIPGRDTPGRFPVRFYLVAMLFVIFDIEIVFLYPWVLVNRGLGLFGIVSVLIFSALVFESFVYLVAKGALEWGPIQVNRRQDDMLDGLRTAESTIRKVGLDGRYSMVVDGSNETESEEAA